MATFIEIRWVLAVTFWVAEAAWITDCAEPRKSLGINVDTNKRQHEGQDDLCFAFFNIFLSVSKQLISTCFYGPVTLVGQTERNSRPIVRIIINCSYVISIWIFVCRLSWHAIRKSIIFWIPSSCFNISTILTTVLRELISCSVSCLSKTSLDHTKQFSL